jgi:hypothetical protein
MELKEHKLSPAGDGLDIVHGDADIMKAVPTAATVQAFREGPRVGVHTLVEGKRDIIEEDT